MDECTKRSLEYSLRKSNVRGYSFKRAGIKDNSYEEWTTDNPESVKFENCGGSRQKGISLLVIGNTTLISPSRLCG